jgi:hypothetical protein
LPSFFPSCLPAILLSGTPISRGLEDLWGLLSCLAAQPWASSPWWWATAIAEPLRHGQAHGKAWLLNLNCSLHHCDRLGPRLPKVPVMAYLHFQRSDSTPACGCLDVCANPLVTAAAAAAAGLETLLQLMAPARGGLLWRSAKADVLGEMGLPAQCHHTTLLRLSAIERHWYNRWAVAGGRWWRLEAVNVNEVQV